MRRVLEIVALVLVVFAGGSAAAAGAPRAGASPSEELRFRWRLEGVSAVLSRLFGLLPTTGDSLMTLRFPTEDRLAVEFIATSEKAAEGDYWKYETTVDLAAWRSLTVRETLHYGKKQKSKSFDLAEYDVLDVLSGLQQLRYAPPAGRERRTIWSGGKVYPVTVTFNAFERRVFEGRDVTVRHLSIRGVRDPDERFWKSRAELWISDDEAALPVELLYHQVLGRLRLTLVEASGGG